MQQFIRVRLDPARDIGARGPTVRGVVLEAATVRRIVRGRDHDPVGEARGSPAVIGEDGVRDGRRRRVFIARRNHDLDAVGSQHLERGRERRSRERMRVKAHEQGSVDALGATVHADRLADRGDMGIVEGAIEGDAAMSRGSERYALRAVGRIRSLAIIGSDQARNVDEQRRRRRLAGERMDARTHDRAGAPLLSAIRRSNSSQDFTNDFAPSCCRVAAS